VTTAKISHAVTQYQGQFLRSLSSEANKALRFVEPVSFGFTPQDATEISNLVVGGIKTATGSVLWSYQADGKALPGEGDFWVVVDGDGNPICVAQTTDVEIIPFDKVPEEYARWGGEGDCSLTSWRRIYWKYIVLECERVGREPSTNAPLIMERICAAIPYEVISEPKRP
jgi:uncharacterized protein YhfF